MVSVYPQKCRGVLTRRTHRQGAVRVWSWSAREEEFRLAHDVREGLNGVDCWRVVRCKFLQQSTPRIPSTRGSSMLLSLGNVGSPIRLRFFDTRLF